MSFTDQVAPFFLFIVGASITLAYSRLVDAGTPRALLYRKIFFRALKIYALGMFLNLQPHFNFSTIRWTGTLQRIAFVFLFCSLIYLHTNWRQQAWLAAILLVAYWLVLTCIPTPRRWPCDAGARGQYCRLVDNLWLPGRMWRVTWDPESILTTVTSVVSGLTGMLAGALLRSSRTPGEKSEYPDDSRRFFGHHRLFLGSYLSGE